MVVQKKSEGFVLFAKDYFDYYLVSVLTVDSEKIICKAHKTLCRSISPGVVITFDFYQKSLNRFPYLKSIDHRDYSFMQCIAKDIFWSHFLLELYHYLIPAGFVDPFILDFLKNFFYVISIQDFFEKQGIIIKKIFIVYFLYKIGLFLEHNFINHFHIVKYIEAFFNEICNGKKTYAVEQLTNFASVLEQQGVSKNIDNMIMTTLCKYVDVALLKTFNFIV
jgi:hypothetical protein